MSTLSMKLDHMFKLTEHGTTVRKELLAGTITAATMAYILAVNPSILSAAGMDSTAVMLATCIASAFGTFLMGIIANLPFAMSAGMGLNAFFAYTVVIGMGYRWENALLAVFVEGVIFILLSATGVREAIFNAIPHNLKIAVSIGIGLFIAFIGFQNVHMVVANSATLVGLVNFRENFNSAGISVILFLIGVVLIGILLVCKVPGAMLIGIIATWLLGIVCELCGIYVSNPEAGYYSLYPHLTATDFGALGLTFGKCFRGISIHGAQDVLQFVSVIFAFLFVDVFDTLGTLTGGAVAGNMLDEDGKLPHIKGALLADAFGTTGGAICGTSTITTYVESVAGIMAGGRTGLTAITTGFWFLVAMFASSFFTSIPSFATAGALVVVGGMMLSNITKLKFKDSEDYLELIPVFLCIIGMVIFYSISEGIAFGVISYVVLNLLGKLANWIDGRDRIKTGKVSGLMVAIAIAFVLKYILL